MRWGRAGRGQGEGSQDRSSRPVLLGRVYGTERAEGRTAVRGQGEHRIRSERYAEKGVRGGSLADVRSIGEVEAGAGGADGLQGAENLLVGKGGVGTEGDNQFWVAGFALGEKRSELVEGYFFRSEEHRTVLGQGEGEYRFWIGHGGGEGGGCFRKIDRELLFHQGGSDHKNNEKDKDKVEEGGDVEFSQSVALGVGAKRASHERGVKRCSKTAAHSAAKFSI